MRDRGLRRGENEGGGRLKEKTEMSGRGRRRNGDRPSRFAWNVPGNPSSGLQSSGFEEVGGKSRGKA